MTNSTANVFQDGAGHLVLKALHSGTDPNSGWTSGRVETQAATFGAPAGGVVEMQASIQQPNLTTANGAGYWPAFWMLGSHAAHRHAVADQRRGRHPRGHQQPQLGVRHAALRRQPGRSVQRVDRHRQRRARLLPAARPAYHTYAVQIDRSVSPEQIRWYLDGSNYFTVNANQVDATTWANAVDHPFFIIFDLAMGGGFPAAFGGGPNAATVSGGQMNIDYVAVYNKGPGSGGGGGGTNIAQGKTTTASSVENATFPASNATDGNLGTRWSSAFSDPQWIQVDLGQSYNISHVTLTWEAAYARSYQIQTSPNGTTWTNIFSTTTGDGGTDDLAVTGTGRYIRMNGTARATPYGYSLFEFAVQGTPGGGGTATLLSQGHPATASSTGERHVPGVQRGRRQHRHPLVERVLRPAVAAGRPRCDALDQSRRPELGGRVRDGVPDPDVERRDHLDHDLLDHHRHRRRAGPRGQRFRTVRADARHPTRDTVRLLALGVPGLRGLTERRYRARLAHRRPRPVTRARNVAQVS